MTTTVRKAGPGDRAEWLRMRRALWDDCPEEQQVREMEEILASDTEEVFFAERPGGGLCGFVEAAIRPCAIGCETRPVGYVEGWYVDEDVRQQGVGRALVEAAEGGPDREAAGRWFPTPSYGTRSVTRLTGRSDTRRPLGLCSTRRTSDDGST